MLWEFLVCVLQRLSTTVVVPSTQACSTNVSRARQDFLSKFVYCRNRTSHEGFKLTLCTCAQSNGLDTCAKSPLEIFTINVIAGIVYFREIILESSRKVMKHHPGYGRSIYVRNRDLWTDQWGQYLETGTLCLYCDSTGWAHGFANAFLFYSRATWRVIDWHRSNCLIFFSWS